MKSKLTNQICPLCKKPIIGRPAHSRLNYEIEICSNCGLLEALEVYYKSNEKGAKENGDKTARPKPN